MTVAQFMTIAGIFVDAGMDANPNKRVNFTQWTSGRVTLRFMDGNGVFHAYSINSNGSYERVED